MCNELHWGFREQSVGENKLSFIVLTVELERHKKNKNSKY